MKNIILRDGGIRVCDWEYLGTVQADGKEYLALQPLDGTSRVCFFSCENTAYRQVAEGKEQVLIRRYRQTAMDQHLALARVAR